MKKDRSAVTKLKKKLKSAHGAKATRLKKQLTKAKKKLAQDKKKLQRLSQ